MGKLTYAAITSLDGYIEDADGEFGWAEPDAEVHAFAAGLVDEVHLFVHPVIVGGGKPALPSGVRIDLELVHERRFASGVVHLHHRTR
jgi:dihydrofolate reductase